MSSQRADLPIDQSTGRSVRRAETVHSRQAVVDLKNNEALKKKKKKKKKKNSV
eukprot:NODE_2118_length_991_cov_191.493590.p5 GENE.NODE_2118_length_991_cov_191.493590~~NODE_2118_length_991_cov_191.493590.p5  ORF type:complete len:53 (-),score=33.56 NODE_2118_length_991_cov_191.493590:13-171(-)